MMQVGQVELCVGSLFGLGEGWKSPRGTISKAQSTCGLAIAHQTRRDIDRTKPRGLPALTQR